MLQLSEQNIFSKKRLILSFICILCICMVTSCHSSKYVIVTAKVECSELAVQTKVIYKNKEIGHVSDIKVVGNDFIAHIEIQKQYAKKIKSLNIVYGVLLDASIVPQLDSLSPVPDTLILSCKPL